MSIVVQVDESVEDGTITEYPWIGRTEYDLIVLFTEPRTGVVMADPNENGWEPGDWCDSWAECTFASRAP